MQAKPDFPYYAGEPVALGPLGWLAVLASVILAFALLISLPLATPPLDFIPAILFTGIPLVTLMAVTNWRLPALFRAFGFRDLALALGFALLTLAASGLAGVLVSMSFPTAPNPAVTTITAMSTAELVLFLARTAIQLVGEEITTIVPLLFVLWLCVEKLGMSRRVGIVAGIVVSTLWFAALHLPTYNWNIMQCLGTIGTARIVLTLAYLLTRNLWVSSIAHIANDWTLFLVTATLGHLPIGVGD